LEESSAGLDEVVVVGYGTQQKKDITGAVATVKGRSSCKDQNCGLNKFGCWSFAGHYNKNKSSGELGNDESSISIRGIWDTIGSL